MTAAGRVILVGAGPGDPGLITLRGLNALREADVVIADRLIAAELLEEIRGRAEIIDAGKAPGRHALTQDEINAALVEHAHAGRVAVRLKGGDPYLYGRGHEELEACRAAGVPCEVVPGVTSALAAPLAAGIPVTARGLARTLAIATPAVGAGDPLTDAEVAALAHADTVCLLMARGALADFARRLIAAGRGPATPAAVIQDATLPSQRVAHATLDRIAGEADRLQLVAPVVVVVGRVAALAAAAEDAPRPLAGRAVLVTRPVTASRRLSERLRVLGADVVEAPLIRIEPVAPSDWPQRLGDFRWIVFTSLHAAANFGRELERRRLDGRALAGAKIAAVGPKTGEALRRVGLIADLIPARHRAAALVDALAPSLAPGDRVLFPSGTLAMDELPAGLAQTGATVVPLCLYDTVPGSVDAALRDRIARGIDAVLLYSPTAARALAAARIDLCRAKVGAIGPTTAAAVTDAGLPLHFTADVYSDDGMIDALTAALAAPPPPTGSP